jgi:glutathione S-transferase
LPELSEKEGLLMLIIHHLGQSVSERILWLCEELELPYELRRYQRQPNLLAPPEYKALHPGGTSPVIQDGEQTLAESGAVVDYILRKYGDGRLQLDVGDPGFADYLYWFHYANGSVLPFVIRAMNRTGRDAATQEAFDTREQRMLGMIEQRLAANAWFAGSDFSAADIMMAMPLSALHKLSPRAPAENQNIRAYLERVSARPAFRRAMGKADPDSPRTLQ